MDSHIRKIIELYENNQQKIEPALHNLLVSYDNYQSYISGEPEENIKNNFKILGLYLEIVIGFLLGFSEILFTLKCLEKARYPYLKKYYILQTYARISETFKIFYGFKTDKKNGLWFRSKSLIYKYRNGIYQAEYDDLSNSLETLSKTILKDIRDVVEHYDKPNRMYFVHKVVDSQEHIEKQVPLLFFQTGKMYELVNKIWDELTSSVELKKTPTSEILLLKHKPFVNSINASFKRTILSIIKDAPKQIEDLHKYHLQNNDIINLCLESCPNNKVAVLLTQMMSSSTDLIYFISFVRADLASAIYTYIKSDSELEHGLCLRRIHIIKTSTISQLYGYNEEDRQHSLWHNATLFVTQKLPLYNEKLNIEKRLEEITSHGKEDLSLRSIYTHYRDKRVTNIKEIINKIEKIEPDAVLYEAMSLFKLLFDIEKFFITKTNTKIENKVVSLFDSLREQVTNEQFTCEQHKKLLKDIDETELIFEKNLYL